MQRTICCNKQRIFMWVGGQRWVRRAVGVWTMLLPSLSLSLYTCVDLRVSTYVFGILSEKMKDLLYYFDTYWRMAANEKPLILKMINISNKLCVLDMCGTKIFLEIEKCANECILFLWFCFATAASPSFISFRIKHKCSQFKLPSLELKIVLPAIFLGIWPICMYIALR